MDISEEEYGNIFRNAHDMAVIAKEAEEDNQSIDPMCIMGFEEMVIPAVMAGIGPGMLLEACKTAVKMTIAEVKPKIEEVEERDLGSLLWVAVIAESYMQTYDKDLEETEAEFKVRMENREHVRFEPLFKQGDPNIREVITTTGIYPGGQYIVTQAFRWTPVDGYEWDEAVVIEGSADGFGDDRWSYFNLITGDGES